jgi:hypothetical protein
VKELKAALAVANRASAYQADRCDKLIKIMIYLDEQLEAVKAERDAAQKDVLRAALVGDKHLRAYYEKLFPSAGKSVSR